MYSFITIAIINHLEINHLEKPQLAHQVAAASFYLVLTLSCTRHNDVFASQFKNIMHL